MSRSTPLVLLSPVLVAATLLFVSGSAFAGSAGVGNGAIQGVVTDSAGAPLADVSIVAARSEDPPVIRSTTSDGQGNYFLQSLPVGSYTLGYSRFGFRTRDTSQGDPAGRTALGSQVRAFVEPSRVSVVPPVPLTPLPSQGVSDVTLSLIDAATGEPVRGATVILGPVATSRADGQGRYRLVVPPVPGRDGGVSRQHRLVVMADGFRRLTETVNLAAGFQSLLFRVEPHLVNLTGFVRLSGGLPPGEVTNVRILVEGVDPRFTNGGAVDPSGRFQVAVPASNAFRTRRFNLSFALRGARVARLAGVVAPRAGSRTVPRPVPIQPRVVDVAGTVVTSRGFAPMGNGFDQVVLQELGRATPVLNGGFVLRRVPVARSYTLVATVVDPATRLVEQTRVSVTPVSDGSGSPVFRVPTLVTRPVSRPLP